VTIIKHDVLTR